MRVPQSHEEPEAIETQLDSATRLGHRLIDVNVPSPLVLTTDIVSKMAYPELQSRLITTSQMIEASKDPQQTEVLKQNQTLLTDERNKKVNEILESFPEHVKNEETFPKQPLDRVEFLEVMSMYLGPHPNAEKHFKQIRAVDLPGNKPKSVFLHERAATRLEAVSTELKGRMPAVSSDQDLRGRFKAHTRESRSRMAHPLGYAVDFRPTSNPMITDSRLVTLLEMQTGGLSHIDTGMTISQRRQLIRQMGEGKADPEKASKFFESFEKGYKNVSKASQEFTQSLGKEGRENLAALRNDYLQARTDLKAAETKQRKNLSDLKAIIRSVSNADPRKAARAKERQAELQDQRAELEVQLSDVRARLASIQAKLPALFEPWLKQIREKTAGLEQQAPDIALVPEQNEVQKKLGQISRKEHQRSLSKNRASREMQQKTERIQALTNQIDREKEREKPRHDWLDRQERKVTQLNDQVKKLNEQLTALDKELSELKGEHERLSHFQSLSTSKKEWDTFHSLESALLTDSEFVFGSNQEDQVKDPSVAQLVRKGFFSPEPETAGKGFDPRHEGFNLTFMKTMMQHGFDQGINWSPGSVDPMHFELVEGVDTLTATRSNKEWHEELTAKGISEERFKKPKKK